MMLPRLNVIVTSTRPQRVGPAIAQWFLERAKVHAKFEVELVDLKEVNLPMLDEPKHPRLRQYEHEHTRKWSRTIEAADAFVFVLPEYNFSMPAAFVNAVDYLYIEWGYKPAGLVTYGGISAGLRAAQMAKQLLTAVKVMPIPESVPIPMFSQHMEDGRFKGGQAFEQSSTAMLDELVKWSQALKTLR